MIADLFDALSTFAAGAFLVLVTGGIAYLSWRVVTKVRSSRLDELDP